MTYRDDLDALGHRHASLEHEVAIKSRELADAGRLLEDARARARLPVLDNLRIASPCTASWTAMVGDERVRHCGSCDKHVFNVSALTREQAEALILEQAGQLCVRYFQRADGTILLGDCTVGIRRKKTQTALVAGAAIAAFASVGTMGMRIVNGGEPMREDWVQGEIAEPYDRGEYVMGKYESTLSVPQVTESSQIQPYLSGDIDGPMVAEAIAPVKVAARACGGSTATGVVSLFVLVEPDGGVGEITVARSLDDATLDACLVTAMKSAHFPPTRSGGTFSYPFVF